MKLPIDTAQVAQTMLVKCYIEIHLIEDLGRC